MKIHLIHAKYGEFQNSQGDNIRFSSIVGLHHENLNEEEEKGCKPVKMKASPSVIRSLSKMPGDYDCEIMPLNNGVEIVSATLIK